MRGHRGHQLRQNQHRLTLSGTAGLRLRQCSGKAIELCNRRVKAECLDTRRHIHNRTVHRTDQILVTFTRRIVHRCNLGSQTVNAADMLVGRLSTRSRPLHVTFRRAIGEHKQRAVSAPYFAKMSSGSTTLFLDFDIFADGITVISSPVSETTILLSRSSTSSGNDRSGDHSRSYARRSHRSRV